MGTRGIDHSAPTTRSLGWTLTTTAALAMLVLVSIATSNTASAAQADSGHVVLLGVTGLVWTDIDATKTPVLWGLANRSAVGGVVVRGVFQRTCASDGWLTLGTGSRTVAPRIDVPQRGPRCTPVPRPRYTGTAWQVPGWPQIVDENIARYDPTFGLMSDSLANAGECSQAVGPGAALMVADATGKVTRYQPEPTRLQSLDLAKCALTAIDLGEVPGPASARDPQEASGASAIATSRVESLVILDTEVGQVLSQLPANSTVVLVSTADEAAAAHIRVLMAAGPGPGSTYYQHGLLSTTSTRQPGLVQLTDVPDLVLSTLDIPPVEPIVGTAPTVVRTTTGVSTLVNQLIELDERAQVIVRITFPINQAIILLLLVVYGAFGLVGFVLAKRNRSANRSPSVPFRFQRALTLTSLGLAAFPVSTYLANVVPWWRLADGPATGKAMAVMLLTAIGFAALLATTVILVPWAHQAYRSVALISGITVGVLTVDVLTGSHLQFASALGLSPIAAGRFYGFGNVAFSVFATCAVFLAVALSGPAVAVGKRGRSALIVAGFGLIVALIDGWPTFGADFGGMVALIIGFGVFAMLISPRGLSFRRIALVVIVAAAFATIVSVLDYLRPKASQTHLGEFVGSVLHGDAGSIVARKLGASLSSFTYSAPAPLIPIVFVVVLWLVLRPMTFRATALVESYETNPTLRAGLISGLVIAGLGAFLNDSGVIVTATMLAVGVPLGVAAVADPRRTTQSRPAKGSEPALPDPEGQP